MACHNAGQPKAELIIYAGQAHGFFNGPMRDSEVNEYFFECLDATDIFLQELGWLEAARPVPSRAFFGA